MCTEPLELDTSDSRSIKNYRFVDSHIGHAFEGKDNKLERVMLFYYHWHRKLNMFGFPIFRVENLFGDNRTAIRTLRWLVEESGLQSEVKDESLMRGEMSDALYTALHTRQNG